MVLDRTVRRDVKKILRHEQRDKGHDLKIRFQSLELFPDFRILVGRRLMHGKFGSKRRFLEWIGPGAFVFRRDIDGDDILTALEQRFQHGLAEGLLAVNDNTHSTPPKYQPSIAGFSSMPGTSSGMNVTRPFLPSSAR